MIQIKQGATFDEILILPEEDFPDGFFLLWDVSSQVRTTKGTILADVTPTWEDPAASTRYLRIQYLDTTSWPLERVELDVRFVRQSDGFVIYSEIELIEVLKRVTIPAP